MTATRKLAELFRAVAASDQAGAMAVATEICRTEEEMGHRLVARILRGALTASRDGAVTHATAAGSSDALILTTGLVRLDSDVSLKSIVLAPAARSELSSVVKEWRHAKYLRASGIQPRAKLLFHGPPGCGKSLAARAMGRELGLPVYMVRFDAVIGAFLGQTAIHLRQLFSFAERTPCILLLDELDALGKRRGNPLDVGELDRIVIALLQELEHSHPAGIVIGTTNLPKHLDDALWRRFDLSVHFQAPTKATLLRFSRSIAQKWNVRLRAAVLDEAGRSRSFAAAEGSVVAEVRRMLVASLENQK
jgi:AAA+ superfamily predicted ATPase